MDGIVDPKFLNLGTLKRLALHGASMLLKNNTNRLLLKSILSLDYLS